MIQIISQLQFDKNGIYKSSGKKTLSENDYVEMSIEKAGPFLTLPFH